jgi:hypothetical protein
MITVKSFSADTGSFFGPGTETIIISGVAVPAGKQWIVKQLSMHNDGVGISDVHIRVSGRRLTKAITPAADSVHNFILSGADTTTSIPTNSEWLPILFLETGETLEILFTHGGGHNGVDTYASIIERDNP